MGRGIRIYYHTLLWKHLLRAPVLEKKLDFCSEVNAKWAPPSFLGSFVVMMEGCRAE